MRSWKVLAAACAVGCAWTGSASAAATLHPLFSEGAVLQRQMPLPVWGTAEPGEKVTVALNGKSETATAGADGKWSLKLPAMEAGGPFELVVESTGGTTAGRQVVKNVLLGEVWICSGQSNMQWSVNQGEDPAQVAAGANYPEIRLVNVPRRNAEKPEATFPAQWKVCTPENVRDFSAVGYHFGRKLHLDLKVPVGLIGSNYGGTPAEAWTSREALLAAEGIKPYSDRVINEEKGLAAARVQWEKTQADHKAAVAQAKKEGKPVPPAPKAPGIIGPHRTCGLYNAMIAPLVPYGIRGAIWYQGESNAGQAYLYRKLFPTMISDWRKQWGQGDFPFLFVQLAPFMAIAKEPTESAWAELREAQSMTLSLPNTGMAVITDVGDEKDIHPKPKAPVGIRLALAALANTYGQKIEYSGPVYQAMQVEGDKAFLSFTHVGQGLEARGGELTGFTICGEDKKFVNATAKIDGARVIVSAPGVEKPVAVRYGWANFPVVNLWNKDGLPASPFRTDSFPGITQPK